LWFSSLEDPNQIRRADWLDQMVVEAGLSGSPAIFILTVPGDADEGFADRPSIGGQGRHGLIDGAPATSLQPLCRSIISAR
jgi:hypothetical protein